MVGRVIQGDDLDGLVRYNEEKVDLNTAICLDAVGFGADPGALSAVQKIRRFEKITSLNAGVEKNAMHFILSFPPEEILSSEQMLQIASRYIDLVGYKDQPHLIYQHTDTANPHLHIVTTNIQRDGTPIDDSWFIKRVAAPARRQVEEEFGLIRAEGRGQALEQGNVPLDTIALEYGQQETKRAISNVVRMVVAQYKFASLGELNAILRQYNVTADPGEKDSKRRQVNGLVYSMVNSYGKKVGRQINASSIHGTPTLKVLKARFEANDASRERFRGRITRIVADAVKQSTTLDAFCDEIGRFGIKAHFHKGKNDQVFGLTFIDTKTRVTFSGSSLGDYSASAILRKCSPADKPDSGFNEIFVRDLLSRTDFSKRPGNVLRAWAREGLAMHERQETGGKKTYWLGRADTAILCFIPMPPKVRAWLMMMAGIKRQAKSKQGTSGMALALARFAWHQLRAGWYEIIKATQMAFDYTYNRQYTPHHFLPKKKKKQQRRP